MIELPLLDRQKNDFQKEIFNYCETVNNKFTVEFKKSCQKDLIKLIDNVNDENIYEINNNNNESLVGIIFLINSLYLIKDMQSCYIYINYAKKIYQDFEEIDHYLKIIKNSFKERFKLDNSITEFINIKISEDKILSNKINTYKSLNPRSLQQKYQIAEKSKNEEDMIALGLFAIKKFGKLYANQLCIIYIILGKFREALHILLYLTYENPLDKKIIAHWGKLSIGLSSQKSYWIMRLGYILYPNEVSLLINYSGSLEVKFSEKKDVFEKIFNISPNNTGALINYANFLAFQGLTSEAVEKLNIAKNSDKSFNQSIESNILFLSQYDINVNYLSLTEKHIEYSKHVTNKDLILNIDKVQPLKSNKIKIGFITPDLINHPVAYYLYNLIKYLPREIFDVYIFYTLQRRDLVTNLFMDMVGDNWKDISRADSKEARKIIIKNNIEILFDCSGHTSGARLDLFYNRSAPIQCLYVGYPYTTGIENIDYKILDNSYEEQQSYFTEKIINVPDSHISYQPLVSQLEMVTSLKYAVQPTPFLKNKLITFGLSTNPSKLNEEVIKVFSNILIKVKNSQLLIESVGFNDESFKKFFFEKFKKNGISSDKLILVPRDSRKQYLIYNEIDVALDPFPYNGGTSTLDLLWMGLPMITLKGSVGMSIEGAAMLTKLGKKYLIANNKEHYVNIACEIASDINILNTNRLSQREIFNNSSLMYTTKFGLNFSDTLLKLYK
jgi:predicted O-linked N-acetylglucosamine transferase (SPINDLY family)